MPRPKGDGLQVRDLINHVLTAKRRKVEAGEMKLKTFGDCHPCAARLVDAFGRSRSVDDLQVNDFSRFRAELLL